LISTSVVEPCVDLDLSSCTDFEIAGLVVQFLPANFLNNVAATDIDFPAVEPVACPL